MAVAVLYYPHTVGGAIRLNGQLMIQILVLSAFVCHMSWHRTHQKPIFEPSAITRPLLLTGLIVIATTITAKNRPLAVESASLFFAYAAGFYVLLSLFKDEKIQILFSIGILLVTVFLCVHGLFYFYKWNLVLAGYYRLRATFGNSNQMAGWLVMAIPFSLAAIFSRKFPAPVFAAFIIGLAVMIICLFFTFARGGWFAAFSGLAFVWGMHVKNCKEARGAALIAAGGFLLLLSLFFLSSTTLSARFGTLLGEDVNAISSGRIPLAKAALKMIKTHPVMGVGPGNNGAEFAFFEPPGIGLHRFTHNDYLHFICETGVFMVLAMVWLIWALFKQGFQNLKRIEQPRQSLTIGAMGGVSGLLVYSFSDFNLHIPANALLFTVMAAMAAAPVGRQVS